MKRLTIALLIGAASGAAIAAGGPKAGQWEYTTEVNIPAMSMPEGFQMPELPEGMELPPGMSMPQMGAQGMKQTMSFKQCITDEEPVPMHEGEDSDCKLTKMDRKGNTVHWAVECQTPEGPSSGEGTATYEGDRMHAEMTMTSTVDGRPMEMHQTINGRYLGPCPK